MVILNFKPFLREKPVFRRTLGVFLSKQGLSKKEKNQMLFLLLPSAFFHPGSLKLRMVFLAHLLNNLIVTYYQSRHMHQDSQAGLSNSDVHFMQPILMNF